MGPHQHFHLHKQQQQLHPHAPEAAGPADVGRAPGLLAGRAGVGAPLAVDMGVTADIGRAAAGLAALWLVPVTSRAPALDADWGRTAELLAGTLGVLFDPGVTAAEGEVDGAARERVELG
jgi:hypothetical protein